MKSQFTKGMQDGIPICFGYLAVGFTFGMAAVAQGLTAAQGGLICVTNLTSAGQFAGLTVIAAAAPYLEMALTQLVINLRYALMSLSLSQKLEPSIRPWEKMIIAFGITDEIFALASTRVGRVTKQYYYGVMVVCILSWSLGGLFGGLASSALPPMIQSALGIAIYGMFLAIILPPAKKDNAVLGVVAIAVILSSALYWLPGLKEISPGTAIIICTVAASAIGAVIRPVKNDGMSRHRDTEEEGVR